jgi:folate-binding protein YgfZ
VPEALLRRNHASLVCREAWVRISRTDDDLAVTISLGTLLVSGADARSFLQGQLSADIDTLTSTRPMLSSCNSAQGRVQAVLWLLERSEGIALILPASLTESIATRLRKYVLRSKVKIDTVPAVELPGDHPYREADWRLAGIRAGLPQVYPETHEAFVAQMLNLDLLGGVSFEKGCYTGQEIIARTHFRGAIKRRMFRFEYTGEPPTPGTRVRAGHQHAGDVVDAASGELLAVINLAQHDAELKVENGGQLKKLPLPYVIPA